jgi:hypothetical protein
MKAAWFPPKKLGRESSNGFQNPLPRRRFRVVEREASPLEEVAGKLETEKQLKFCISGISPGANPGFETGTLPLPV